MTRKQSGVLVGLAVIILAGLGGYFVWAGRIAGGKQLCDICNREMHPEAAFTTVGDHGAARRTCCPRCGLRAVLVHGGRAVQATDFATGKPIPAKTAVYLEGSDIMECCSTSGFRAAEGTYQVIEFDRCMPSLVAFSSREEAEGVRQKHGGEIITFDQARQSVERQLNR
jgi:hypothetical protein